RLENKFAFYNLGIIYYLNGDIDKAVENFNFSLLMENNLSLYALGIIYVKINYEKSLQYFQQGYEKGEEYCILTLGIIIYKEGDTEEGMKCIRLASDLGNIIACFELGYIYSKKREDYVKGVKYLRKAAKTSNQEALYFLGEIYLKIGKIDKTIKYW